MPIGPNKLLLGNSSGWLARLTERWQSSVIFNLATGSPTSITAANMLYANGVADVVGSFDARTGSVHWGEPGGSGQLAGGFFESGRFAKVDDPQCGRVAASLQSVCTLDAVMDTRTGQIVLQNPLPGKRGTLGRQTIENPGSWDFDANISKTFRLTESKSVQVRVDATNILNHPVPSNPSLSINSANPLGFISGKGTAHREFQGQLRLSF